MSIFGRMDWTYFRLDKDGYLRDEDGDDILTRLNGFKPKFKTTQEAEQYLEDEDIRGSVL